VIKHKTNNGHKRATSRLENGGLILALGSIESREARADTLSVVTQTTTRAVSASLITVTIKGIITGGTLLHVTSGASVASITEATNVLHGIPGLGVGAASLGSQVLLGPTSAAIITVIGAQSSLASNTVIAREAGAGTGGSIAGALVRALSPGVQIVGIDDITNPGEVLGASSQGAIRSSPLGLTVQTSETLAIVVHFTCTMIRAMVLAQSTLSVSSLVPGDLTPRLGLVRGSRSGNIGGLRRRSRTGLGSRILRYRRSRSGRKHRWNHCGVDRWQNSRLQGRGK